MNDDRTIENLLDITDSEETSSSSNTGVFEAHQPFVLELHELKKDEPTPANPPEGKVKRYKKKKKNQPATNRSNLSVSSDSTSGARSVSPTALDETVKEEFYDAHESYHALPENQASNPVAAIAIMQGHSEHEQNPKIVQEQDPSQGAQPASATRREPSSAITKPVMRPE